MVDDDGDDVPLSEGMPVVNGRGEKLGVLAALLVEEEDEDAEFLLLGAGGKERLVPFEAILGVEDGSLVLDVPAASVGLFPALAPEAEPTQAQMDLSYEVFDEGASEDEEEDEEDEDDA